jgi:hypothetical protein
VLQVGLQVCPATLWARRVDARARSGAGAPVWARGLVGNQIQSLKT